MNFKYSEFIYLIRALFRADAYALGLSDQRPHDFPADRESVREKMLRMSDQSPEIRKRLKNILTKLGKGGRRWKK